MRRLALLLCLLGPGCAGTQTAAPERITPASANIYMAGEQAFEAGRYATAVRLWRHALLQLPPIQEADALRHKLILRIAYGQLHAHAQSGQTAHLQDAQAMLLKYAAKHQAIFGESDAHRKERGQVYEILYEVESRLEPREPDDGEAAAVAQPSEAKIAATAPASTATADHAGETLAEGRRKVDVGVAEDPRVRGRLESDYSDAMVPVVYLPAGIVHGPRPLVRLGGRINLQEPPPATDDGRERARELLRTARPALRACYGDAFSRRPVAVVRPVVEAQLHADGSVSHVRLVEGSLVDGLGDVCLIEQLEGATVAVAHADARVRIPLTFFWEGPVYFDVRREAGRLNNNGNAQPISLPEANRGAPAATSSD